MSYSRTGIVAMLLAAEAFVAGGILTQASSLHPEHYHATAAGDYDAGSTPHVVVDDRDSRIVVTPSTDGRVHVSDMTREFGFVWSSTGRHRNLSIARTADGVSVTRPGDGYDVGVLGYQENRVELQVPPASFLDVRGCAGVTISGIRAERIGVTCQDGSLRLSDVALQSGNLQTADGSVRLSLLASDTTVHAVTNDGSLRLNGQRVRSETDRAETTFQMGSGSGRLEVGTHDGSIRISTQGV